MFLFWRCIRWFLSYSELEIRGGYGERVLSLCMSRSVEIWSVRRKSPGVIRLRVLRAHRSRLSELARKCGSSLEQERECGLVPLLSRYRLRVGLLVGAFLYFSLLFLLSRFVWAVEVPGTDPFRSARIRSILAEEGFGTGSYAPSVDFRRLKYVLMMSDPDISFVSVNLRGSRAIVEVSFGSGSAVEDARNPCNIVASRDGQILSVLVKNGLRCVQKGQTVRKGDLLVGGLIDTRLGYYAVHSEAEILARVNDVDSYTVSLDLETPRRTGRVYVRRIWNFFGTCFEPFSGEEIPFLQYDTVTEKKHLSFGDECTVPITLTELRYYETSSETRRISAEEAEFYARRALNERDRIRLCGITVERTAESVTGDGNSVTVTRQRSLIVDICEKKEFYFEDEGY